MGEILTKDFAIRRRNQIGDVEYGLFLSFKPKSDSYSGKCKISFFLKGKDDGVFLESVSNVRDVSIGGKRVSWRKEGIFIILNEGLEEGKENSVEINYEARYDHTGSGLHHFTDPEDENEYVYSNFEPYSAHRMFPCFDQPDIKATLKLSVEIPEDWIAISNEPGEEKLKDGFKVVSFPETRKLSTYLFHVSLGNYGFFEGSYGETRMRIYFRKSMKKYVPYEEMFRITKQGLKFYSEFFDYPYPFAKYDQIFVPEFNNGAMENPGAITFSEHYLMRRALTRTERINLANTVLHEMAHMWFGDLVTMKWWDDLWLNESFADFMSYFVMANATEFREAWVHFYARKSWAYYQDQLSTTHPIYTNAEDTDTAFSNFDGISYAKGASVLKQLMLYIGEESFRNGLRSYFKRYEWGNTELKNFLECMEESYGKSLGEWFDSWIKTTGVNASRIEYDISKGKIEGLKIIQGPSKDNNLLRKHKAKLAFFYMEESLKPETVKDVSYYGPETIIDLNDVKDGFKFVYANYGDWDYVKDFLDNKSMEYLLKNIGKVDDVLTRHMIYGSLWQMVRDAELSPKKMLELIFDNMPKEKDLFLMERLFLRIKAMLTYYVSDSLHDEYCRKFFQMALKMLNSKTNLESKNLWFNLLVFSASDAKNKDILVSILNNDKSFPDFELDQDKRWGIIAKLNSLGHENSKNIIESERKIDKSDRGVKMAAIAEASHLNNKKKFWDLYLSGEGKSLDYIRDAMAGFYWKSQKNELKHHIDLFFENIAEIFEKHDKYYIKALFENLFPLIYVDEEVLKKARVYLKKFRGKNKLLTKYMKEGIDDLERALKIMKKHV